MFGAILKATNSSFQKGMTLCRSVYVKKVMKLLAFIFEQPSYFASLSVYLCLASHNANQLLPLLFHRKRTADIYIFALILHVISVV